MEPEIVALIVSATALLISAASLYLTSLRRATIEVDQIEAEHQFPHRLPADSWTDHGVLQRSEAWISLFVFNSGAHGGVLEALKVTEMHYHGAQPGLWNGATTGHLDNPPPKVLVAGEGLAVNMTVLLDRDGWSESDRNALRFAERLAGFRSICLKVEWTYRRAAALPAWVWPGKRSTRKPRELWITVDGADYCRAVLDHWRPHESYRELYGVPADPEAPWEGPPQQTDAAFDRSQSGGKP